MTFCGQEFDAVIDGQWFHAIVRREVVHFNTPKYDVHSVLVPSFTVDAPTSIELELRLVLIPLDGAPDGLKRNKKSLPRATALIEGSTES